MVLAYPAPTTTRRPDKSVTEVCHRVNELVTLNGPSKNDQRRTRDIMDGGPAGLRALAGPRGARDLDLLDQLPSGNPMLSGLTHLSQKLQAVPDLKVQAPKDSNAAKEHAERRERIIRALDEACDLELQLPQVGLWLPGYAYAVWVIAERRSPDGHLYPHAELRDPIDAYPGDWGVDQQPADIAFLRNIPARTLLRKYPEHSRTLLAGMTGPGGAVLLGNSTTFPSDTTSGWENLSQGIQIAEYYDDYGCWWVVPDRNLLLEYRPLPQGMTRPAFVVAKRFAFSKLVGHYSHVIGLLAMHARLTVWQAQWTQDNINTETNIYGQEPAGGYHKGRFAVNVLDPGTKIDKPVNNMPFQAFQAIDRLERQLRVTARYPVTDDAQSPNSFVTGAGLEELSSTMSLEVREYQTVLRRAIERLDSLRLEWEDRAYAQQKRPLVGEYRGEPYTETYRPAVAIAGNYRTRRKYGFMAGWEESRKLVGGLQLVAGEIIPKAVMRENLDGLDESLTRVEELIRAEKAEAVAMDTMLAMAQQGDIRAIQAAIDMLPASPLKTALQKFFIPEEEEAPVAAEPALPEQPPDLASVLEMVRGGGGEAESLARLTAAGNTGGGVQVQAAI